MPTLPDLPVARRLRGCVKSIVTYRRYGWYKDSEGIWEKPHWTDRRKCEAAARGFAALSQRLRSLGCRYPWGV